MTAMPTFTRADMKRWPIGVEQTEVIQGRAYFYGDFNEDDVETAQRAFPGYRVELDPWDDEGTGNNLVIGG
jgi:hypothetical protein